MFDKTGVHSYLIVGCRIYYSVKKALGNQNDLMLQNTAGRAVTSVDRREPVRKFQMRIHFSCCTPLYPLKVSGYFHNYCTRPRAVTDFRFLFKQR